MHRCIVASVLLLTACGLKQIDPCADGSPLQVDPKVKEACEAMAETGGEADEFACVTPLGYPAYALCVPNTYDANNFWVPLTQGSLGGSTADHRSCTPAAQYKPWASPEHASGPAYICPSVGANYSSPNGQAFALEENNVYAGYMRSIPRYGWNDVAMTEASALVSGQISVLCPKGVLCVAAKDDCFCKCESDVDCSGLTRTEAVCELNMCFYVDEPASPGALPSGPLAYGFDSWSEGLLVVGDSITLTPAFFAALVPGVFRDDQSFDADGRIQHCGRTSLCAHLGLGVGDTAVADDGAVDALLAGQSVEVEVIHADGSDRTVTVRIDFDPSSTAP